jgi:tetratricopeptide (TPR) repeat protein
MLLILTVLLACDRHNEKRKIKLSNQTTIQNQNQQLTTTIRLEPKERRSIAVMFFQNMTGDQNLQWLQKGLTEMIIRALSQSSYLSILSTERLVEILDRVGATKTSQDIDLDMAALVGKEANVEAVLVGQIKKKGGVLSINVKLQEPSQGFILKEENVEGKGIDAIFSMVDELTKKVKNDLQLTFEKAEAIRGISDITTNNLDAWREFTIGKDFVDKFLSNDAIPHYEQAVALDSNFAAAILGLYPLYRKTEKTEQALRLFQKLHQLKPGCTKNEQYRIDLIEANLSNDDLKYLQTLEQWLEKCPDDLDAYMRMADLYRGWSNWEEEIRCLQNLLQIDPKYKLAYNKLAYDYAFIGNFDEAVAALNQYKELASDEPNPYNSSGEIYLLYGEYNKAEQSLKQALAINNTFLHSILKLGHLYLLRGDYKQALNWYQQYLEKATNSWESADANYMLGNTYLILEDKEQAREHYQKALEEDPFNLLGFDLLCETYRLPDDSSKVNDHKQKAYTRLKEKLNSETQRERALGSLVWLSIFHDVNKSETIEILKQVMRGLENSSNPSAVLYLSNMKFLLTLLYGRTRQYDEIDPLWVNQEIVPSEFWRYLRDVHSNSYSDQWVAYGLLNKLFYNVLDRGFALYQPLIQYAEQNHAQSMEMMLRLFLADLYRAGKDTLNFQAQRKYVGVPYEKTWMVIGPFDYKDGFRKKYPPEKKIKLDKIYNEGSWQVKWQHADDGMEDGFINFKEIFEKDNWKVAYGLLYIDSPGEREVQFRFGSDDGNKVWLNDQEIWKLNRSGDAIFDADKRPVKLRKGRNKVLIKVCNTFGDWGFFFRVTDEKGIGIEEVRFVAVDEVNS